MRTGKIIERGKYAFSEDTLVFFDRGRVLTCVLDDDGIYELIEVEMKGF